MPKIGKCKILGRPIYQGRPKYPQITTINIYLLIEIRHDIHIQMCHGNYNGVKKINHMLEIDILRNYSQIILGVLRGNHEGLGVQMTRRR